MNTKHTPGRWSKDRNMIQDETGQDIATVDYGQSGYVQANANLIAAAPELLAAMKGLLAAHNAIRVCHNDAMQHRDYSHAIQNVRAAIAKAEKGTEE